jgi:integrase
MRPAEATGVAEHHPPSAALLATEEIERAKTYGRAAKSARTRHEYDRDWADFEDYCRQRSLAALPAEPQTVARYLAALARRLKIATIRRRAISISQRHQQHGLETPTAHKLVRDVLTGIANAHGSAPQKKTALTLDLLRLALFGVGGSDLKIARDRAILLLGFAGAFRRAELAALDVVDLVFDERGLTVTLRRSKTDQQGAGREVGIPALTKEWLCPVRAMRAWLELAGITEGAVFRSFALPHGRARTGELEERRIDGRDVARLVQAVTRRSHVAGDFGAHSLRAGFVTSAAQKKVPEVDIQRVTGHRSVATLRGYVRRATLFEDPPLLTIMDQK